MARLARALLLTQLGLYRAAAIALQRCRAAVLPGPRKGAQYPLQPESREGIEFPVTEMRRHDDHRDGIVAGSMREI
jgi:hypothetical protein